MRLDPVCQADVDENLSNAHMMLYKGNTYYFCSVDCLDTFNEDPEKFTSVEFENDVRYVFEELGERLHQNSRDHGFWDDVEEIEKIIRNCHSGNFPEVAKDKNEANKLADRLHAMMLAEKIALSHSELSEQLEAVRKNPNAPDRDCPEFTNFEIERADVIIRELEVGYHEKLRIGEAIIAKMKFNASRPYKHGKVS